MNLYADIFGRNRIWIALLALVMSAIAGYGITFLKMDDVPRKLFASDDEDYHRLEKLFADFGSDDNDVVIVLDSKDLFSREGVQVIRNVASRCRELPGIVSVQSLADVVVFPKRDEEPRDQPFHFPHALLPVNTAPEGIYKRASEEAHEHPLVHGQLLSNDGTKTLIFARIRGDLETIEDVQPIVDKISDILAEETKGTHVSGSLTGIPKLRVDVIQSLRKIQLRYTILGIAIAFLVGILVFRRPGAVLIATLPPFVGVFWALGVLGLMGEKLNVINSVMPSMMLVIAFCDSVHLLARIRAARQEGMGRVEACQTAIRHVGLACFMASFTTAIGFGSLVVANVNTIRDLGIDTAIGVMVAFCATMTLVPILATTSLANHLSSSGSDNSVPKPVEWIVRLLATVVTWPRTVAVAGFLASAYLAFEATQLQPDNRITETLPTDSESYRTMARCDEAFGGVLLAHVVIDWPEGLRPDSPELLAVLNEMQALFDDPELKDNDGNALLQNPMSILNVYDVLPGRQDRNARSVMNLQNVVGANLLLPPSLIERFIREDLRRAIVSVHIRDIGSQAYKPVFRRLEEKLATLEQENEGFQLALTGTAVVASMKVEDMITSMNNGLVTAAIIIFATMALAFRSLLLGALCIMPNLFPLLFVAGTLVWLDQPLQLATVIVFNVGIGMTVDNTIHFITRFQQELPVDGDVKAAIERTGREVGNPMLSTVVVLLAGFGSLMISSIPVTRLFSLLTCAILGMALVADLILLPAMIGSFVRSRRPGSKRKAVPALHVALEPDPALAKHGDPERPASASSP